MILCDWLPCSLIPVLWSCATKSKISMHVGGMISESKLPRRLTLPYINDNPLLTLCSFTRSFHLHVLIACKSQKWSSRFISQIRDTIRHKRLSLDWTMESSRLQNHSRSVWCEGNLDANSRRRQGSICHFHGNLPSGESRYKPGNVSLISQRRVLQWLNPGSVSTKTRGVREGISTLIELLEKKASHWKSKFIHIDVRARMSTDNWS